MSIESIGGNMVSMKYVPSNECYKCKYTEEINI